MVMRRRSQTDLEDVGSNPTHDTSIFFFSSPKLEGLHLCEDYDEEDYQYLLRRGILFDVAVIWRIVKRKDLTPEQRYCAFIHLKIVACGIVLRNKAETLPIVRIPRIYDQEPGIFFNVNASTVDSYLLEADLFYKILLQNHRVFQIHER